MCRSGLSEATPTLSPVTDNAAPATCNDANQIESPRLRVAEDQPIVVWEDSYPGAKQITDPEVLDDWLEDVDQTLVEARNGVTSISWPFALGGLLALLAVLSDVIDEFGVASLVDLAGWLDLLRASPARLMICVILVLFTIAAFRLAYEGAQARRTLVGIRASYLRRRRELGR